MKKNRLVLVMLALALVFGSAFVSCGETPEEEKTMEALFEKVKSFNVPILAWNANNEGIYFCPTDKKWEYIPQQGVFRHGEEPPFDFVNAVRMGGSSYWTQENANNVPRDFINALNSFYTDKYKLSTPPQNTFSQIPDGTQISGYYTFNLNKTGAGQYGGSAVATVAPLMSYNYQF